MKYLPIILCLLFLATPVYSATELYMGHSIRGMSEFTGEEIYGFNHGNDYVRVGGGAFGATKFTHLLFQVPYKYVFAGIGVGAVDKHPNLDGHFQFTLTAGVRYNKIVVRWMHFSNGAGIFNRHNEEAQIRNAGMDFIVLGVEL